MAQGACARDKAGRHALLQPASCHLCHTQQLDAIAHILGQPDVVDRHAADAFQFNRAKGHFCAKGDGGEKGELVARINAADVKVGVSLKIAQLARLFEDGLIGQVFRLHARQDVIARAVHHAHDAAHLVARQPFGQGLDHGNAAGHGRLEPDHPACRFGRQGQSLPVMGQKRLVGRNHILAGGNRRLGRVAGRAFMAAHHLDEHIDIFAVRQGHRIGFPRIARQIGIAVFRPITRRDGGDHHGAARAGGDQRRMLLHDFHHANPYGPQTRKAKTQGGTGCGGGHGRILVVIAYCLLAVSPRRCNATAARL